MRTALLASALAVALGGTAQAAGIDGWYLGLEGGANWIEDWEHDFFTTPAVASLDTGWTVLATAGYGWSQWRFEFEAGYRDNDLDAYAFVGGAPLTFVEAETWEATLMANVLYDIELTRDLSLSLGAGAGADFANVDLRIGAASADADDWNFAYQGIAGLNYAVGRRTSLFVNYRYLRVVDAEFDFRPTLNVLLTDGEDVVKHAATIGLRYALHTPQTMSDAVVSAPPPEPVSSAPRQFIVFFGFNKYNLTSEALRVISEAVVAAKETGSASVLITGHTDTVGSNGYNQRLSMRRSNAVRSEMVRQGIPAAAISASGKGETELLVQTADGVKEPQNRRATIDLN
jgi:outer membrane protein OmpA-like peptidoglycan-associated protein